MVMVGPNRFATGPCRTCNQVQRSFGPYNDVITTDIFGAWVDKCNTM